MFSSIKDFNLTVWLIIFSTLLTRFSFFMVWPFLAIILYQKFGLNEFEIGAFITIAIVIGVSFGFYIGYLSDKVGRRKIILLGLIVSIASLFTLGMADSIFMMMAGMIAQSIARGMVENLGKALMTDMLERREAKDLALQLRYFTLNIGAAFGPFAGVFIGITGQQTTFFFVAAIYILYLIAASIVFAIEAPINKSKMASDFSMAQLIGVLRKDHAFLIFVFCLLTTDKKNNIIIKTIAAAAIISHCLFN